MSCSSCMPVNPCGCKKKKSCDDCPVVDWVPNTACTIGVTMNGCTDTLELRPGIQNCETKTHMTQNQTTGCIEYQNELYVATDGQEGYIESICPVDIAKFINLEDLANVEDEEPENCSLLVYKAENDCGPGCTGISDSWVHWYASEHLTNGLHWVAGFNSNGCLEALDVPPRTDEYWWGMYRPSDTGNGVEFGYIQPQAVESLPTDASGNTLVISQDETGKPLVGPISTSFCGLADWERTRSASSDEGAGFWQSWVIGTTGASDDFAVVPEGNPGWRAPCCGVLIVKYCINIEGVYGSFEIDTTLYNANEGSWTSDLEKKNSTHSTWTIPTKPAHDTNGVSESCVNFIKLSRGEYAKLHARQISVPIQGGGWDTHINDVGTTGGRSRIHAVSFMFIPLEAN